LAAGQFSCHRFHSLIYFSCRFIPSRISWMAVKKRFYGYFIAKNEYIVSWVKKNDKRKYM